MKHEIKQETHFGEKHIVCTKAYSMHKAYSMNGTFVYNNNNDNMHM